MLNGRAKVESEIGGGSTWGSPAGGNLKKNKGGRVRNTEGTVDDARSESSILLATGQLSANMGVVGTMITECCKP